jgi:hypothetical protein
MTNIYINKIFIYIKLILSYIIGIMFSYKSSETYHNKLEAGEHFNIYCCYCRKLIQSSEKIYCIHDKTFCTLNCRMLFLKN